VDTIERSLRLTFASCFLPVDFAADPGAPESLTMKKLLQLSFALLFSGVSATVLAADYGAVQADKSSITFVSKQMGVPVKGHFRRFSAQLSFTPAKPETARTRVEIDLASIDAGSREADDEVVGKDWFHVRNFPSAVFESKTVKPLGGNRYEVRGTLTIKGKNREVVAVSNFREEGSNGIFDGAFTLKRLDFGIGEGAWGDPGTVADEVQVSFRLVAAALPGRKK